MKNLVGLAIWQSFKPQKYYVDYELQFPNTRITPQNIVKLSADSLPSTRIPVILRGVMATHDDNFKDKYD